MDGSDHEDPFTDSESTFSADLSPTDGYFSNRELPRHYYAADTSLNSRQEAPKVVEAARESQYSRNHNITNSFDVAASPQLHRVTSASLPSESTPLLHNDLAPPPYTDADAQRSQRVNGQPAPLSLFNTSRDPESMVGDRSSLDDHSDTAFTGQRRWPWNKRLSRRITLRAACAFGTIFVLFLIIVKALSSKKVSLMGKFCLSS